MLVAALFCLVAVACRDYDLADRRGATQDEYAVSDQACAANNEHVVANGVLTNHSGEPNGFAVVVPRSQHEVIRVSSLPPVSARAATPGRSALG